MNKKYLFFSPLILLVIFGYAWIGKHDFLPKENNAGFTVGEMVTQTFSAQTSEALSTERVVTLTSVVTDTLTPTPLTVIATQQTVQYTFLREWQVAGAPKGYGADILVEEDVTPEELMRFVINMAGEQDPVSINIWCDLSAYQEMNETSDSYKSGYILVYTRQTVKNGALEDADEIEWKQQVGKFSEYYGQTVQVVSQ